MDHLKDKIKALVESRQPEYVAMRRHLHSHPELSYKEYETSAYVKQRLDDLGISHETVLETGVKAVIEGKNPEAKQIALRADLDALPIVEANEVAYKSKNEGVMHACGHDVHTTSLLGVAGVLQGMRDEFEGSIALVFQPGEEKLPGGASLLIKDGLFDRLSAKTMVGQHVFPELEAGKVGFRSGMYMASADEIYLTVRGKGGHAALPHYVKDTVLIASHIVVALQQVVSRNANPLIPSVLSFGKIEGLGATNVIPAEVKLEGTFRTMDETWRNEAHEHIREIAESVARGMGGSCEVDIHKGYPCLVNDEGLTGKVRAYAEDFLGKENVVDLDLRMSSEDFAYYSQLMPSCFYRLGVRDEANGKVHNLHSPYFDVDEDALKTGIGLMSWIALKQLAES